MWNNMIPMLILVILFPFLMIIFNKVRTNGKVLLVIAKEDRSVAFKLNKPDYELFVHYNRRAYQLNTNFARLTRYPFGWPGFMQEVVPAFLLDEAYRDPLNWVDLENRVANSLELGSALDENWIAKIVQESSKDASLTAKKWSLKKALPFIIIGAGIIGLVVMFLLKSKTAAPPTAMDFNMLIGWCTQWA